MTKEVILTGLRSNAEFHLGNYLGAILPMVEMQKKHAGQYQINMFVPDLHSFTTPVDHDTLYEQSLRNLEVFVASGLDIADSDTFIYRQSYISAHSEMTWILSCFIGFGLLERMTQFKDKFQQIAHDNSQKYNDAFAGKAFDSDAMKAMQAPMLEEAKHSITAGLAIYPILMAADILLYNTKWIPVGEDQRQHVEFTRDLAIRMNNKFGELFTIPEDNNKQAEFIGRKNPVRIRSLRSPDRKMSKSADDPAGTIMLSDNPEDAAAKVTSATTDSQGVIRYDFEKQPGISNLLQILALLSDKPQDQLNQEWEGKTSYGELKSAVADSVKIFLSNFQAKLAGVSRETVLQKLEQDEAKMAEVAKAKLLEVQKAVGLRPKT